MSFQEKYDPSRVIKTICWLVIAFIVYYVFMPESCGGIKESHTVSGYKYDSSARSTITKIGDTSAKAILLAGVDTTYVDRWRTLNVHDTIPTFVDTAAVIRAFFNNAYYYTQTIRDSELVIIIQDTIFQNQPIYRKVTSKNLRATRYDTTIVNVPRSAQWLFGADISLLTPNQQLRPGIIYQTRRGDAIGIHSDVLQKQPNLSLSIHLKIK